MKFNEAMHDQYLSFMADIKLCQEQIASMKFVLSTVESGGYAAHIPADVEAARNVINSHLHRRLNDAYAKLFVYRGMFTDEEELEIDRIAADRYTHLYRKISECMELDKPVKPKSWEFSRIKMQKEMEDAQTKEHQDKIIDTLEGDLPS